MKENYKGLTEAEVLASREQNGSNIVPAPEGEPLWKQYLEKFSDPLIIILLIAGAFSLAISCYEYFGLNKTGEVFFEPVGIFIAILLATGMAFIFELKANREFELLNTVNDDEGVMVIREGNPRSIPRKDVVVGDIIIIESGEEIPADAELLEAVSLTMNEATLTGEPSCRKSADKEDFDKEATFPTNHVLRGTTVMEGHGLARVFAVGKNTENGKVMQAVQIDDSVKTPLNEQLDGLADWITKASYCIAGLVIVGRLLIYFLSGESTAFVEVMAYLLQSVMIAVTLIVVAVPEGLPMAVTLSLAYSMRRMLKTNNLVRKMHACETMGAISVICTDKTGTLTCNQMSVEDIYPANLPPDLERELILDMALNSTARLNLEKDASVLGNPTEGALLLWLHGKGQNIEGLRRTAVIEAELPFSTRSKFMATQARLENGDRYVFVKGAPEIVLGMCSKLAPGLGKEDVQQKLLSWQQRAMRTLGFASAKLAENENCIEEGKLEAKNLCFLGIAGIADPVRPDVPDAVAQCRHAGIAIKIVTGDTPGTAKEIARNIGLWQEGDSDKNLVTGPEVAAMSDEELQKRVESIKIIARARPMDKERLVRALQHDGEVVAVTGDGTNDAPALKAAHVGLSMGDGTSVAREASDITIIDNSFASIGRAVVWGRSLYLNIQRFILFQMTVNVAACLTVLAGAFMGTQSPLTVTQMLWINLIMDTFAAMALASLPPSPDVMNAKPRKRSDFIISMPMLKRILFVGGLFFVFLTILAWFMDHHAVTSISSMLASPEKTKAGLTLYEGSLFFTIFVMLQFWNLFNAKAFATGKSALHFKNCQGFLIIVAIIFIGQILILNIGGHFFNVMPISLSDWLWIVACTSIVLWIGEIVRIINQMLKAVQ